MSALEHSDLSAPRKELGRELSEILREYIGNPRPLNPSQKLRDIAETRGWPVRTFKRRAGSNALGFTRNVATKLSLVGSALAGLPIWALTGSRQEARNFATSLFADVAGAVAGLKLDISGEKHLWVERPAVFIFNHQSDIDVLICSKLLRRNFTGVGKAEIKQMPLVGAAMEMAGVVTAMNTNGSREVIAPPPVRD